MNEITFALQFTLCESKTEARLTRGSAAVLLERKLRVAAVLLECKLRIRMT